MAEQKNKTKLRGVDDAGIRLAPPPMNNASYHVMPSVMQEYIIEPHIVVDEPKEADKRIVSTAGDFQPRKEDANKKWKRQKRAGNIASGLLALVASVAVLLPYLLSLAGTKIDAPFKLTLDQFNVVAIVISAFKQTAAIGWKGEAVKAIWLNTVPSLILTIGIFAVLVNVIKSLFATFGAVKPIKYAWGAFTYLACVLAVFVATLVGAPAIGVGKIDFMADFIHGFRTSETFTLIVFGAGYMIICALLSSINKDKCGYLK